MSKYQEVTNNLEFAKELQRSFLALSQDVSKYNHCHVGYPNTLNSSTEAVVASVYRDKLPFILPCLTVFFYFFILVDVRFCKEFRTYYIIV